jgi:hypothetical protein
MTVDNAIKFLVAQRDRIEAIQYGQIILTVQAGKFIRVDYHESHLLKS